MTELGGEGEKALPAAHPEVETPPHAPLPAPPQSRQRTVTESARLCPSECWSWPPTRPGEPCRDKPAATMVTQKASAGQAGKLMVGEAGVRRMLSVLVGKAEGLQAGRLPPHSPPRGRSSRPP